MNFFKGLKNAILPGFILWAIILWACGAWGATYYVDSDGTTTATTDSGDHHCAWPTIAKVNAASFSGDDQILFNRGQTWREQLTVPSSGTSGHPITFGAYGSGLAPTISAADVVSSWSSFAGETVVNGTFEVWSAGLPTGWNVSTAGTSTFTEDTVNQRTGTACGHMWADAGGDSVSIQQTISITGSTTYTLSGWAKGTASKGYKLTIQDNASPNNYWDYTNHRWVASYTTNTITPGTTYSQVSDTIITNSGTTSISITITRYNISTDMYFDDWSFVNASTPANVWSASVAVEPNILWISDVVGSKKTSISALTSSGYWYWSSGVLYLNYGSNPTTTVEVGSRDYAITQNAKSYITVDSLTLTKSNSTVYGNVVTNASNFTLSNSTLSGSALVGIFAGSGSSNGIITGCIIINNSSHGISLGSNAGDTWSISNNTISGNGWSSVGGSGIISGKSSNIDIGFCTIHDNGASIGNGSAYGHMHGIYFDNDQTSSNNVVHNCVIYNQINGNGITIKRQVNAYQNLIYDNGLAGIGVEDWNTNTPAILLAYNILHGNAYGISEYNAGSGALTLSIENNTTYLNTAGSGYPAELDIEDDLSGLTVKNNIFYTSNSTNAYSMVAQTGTVAIDNNLVYRAGAGNFTFYNGASRTWAAWQGLGFDAHGKNADPLFVSTSTPDFRLQPSSPAIGAGTNVGLTTDYYGNWIPTGHESIGAVQYQPGFVGW